MQKSIFFLDEKFNYDKRTLISLQYTDTNFPLKRSPPYQSFMQQAPKTSPCPSSLDPPYGQY